MVGSKERRGSLRPACPLTHRVSRACLAKFPRVLAPLGDYGRALLRSARRRPMLRLCRGSDLIGARRHRRRPQPALTDLAYVVAGHGLQRCGLQMGNLQPATISQCRRSRRVPGRPAILVAAGRGGGYRTLQRRASKPAMASSAAGEPLSLRRQLTSMNSQRCEGCWALFVSSPTWLHAEWSTSASIRMVNIG
jgi:hypothetical protein